jgi:hypothetical protein
LIAVLVIEFLTIEIGLNVKKLIFLVGPDDNNKSKLMVKDEKTHIECVGILPLLDVTLLQSEEIVKNSQLLVLGVHKSITIPKDSSNFRFVNLVGDSDGSLKSLTAIEKLLNDLAPAHVLNSPVDVYKTSRVKLPALLQQVQNVKVARAEAVQANNLSELVSAIKTSNIPYPLIVRLSGYHNSQYIQKVNSESDLNEIVEWFNVSQNFIVLEFIDCLNINGYFRKARIAVIDGEFYPQHYLSSEHWCVGVENRYKLMMENPSLRNDERLFFESFKRDIYPKYEKALHAIHERIGLDIYGIDCFLKENGEIVIFEANPCMDLLSMWSGPENEYGYKTPHRAAVRNAIVKVLSS